MGNIPVKLETNNFKIENSSAFTRSKSTFVFFCFLSLTDVLFLRLLSNSSYYVIKLKYRSAKSANNLEVSDILIRNYLTKVNKVRKYRLSSSIAFLCYWFGIVFEAIGL